MDVVEAVKAAQANGHRVLDELTSKAILRSYGIETPVGALVTDDTELDSVLSDLKGPFAMKASSPDLLHKSDVGGVALNLPDAEAVANAIASMERTLGKAGMTPDGYLVEEMAPPGHEFAIGATHDEQFGPVVMAGMGGVFIEIFEDYVFGLSPLTRQDAIRMLEELKARPLLDGVRGDDPANLEKLVDAILAIGGTDGLLANHASLFAEIDINPIIVSARGAVAVDACFVLRQP